MTFNQAVFSLVDFPLNILNYFKPGVARNFLKGCFHCSCWLYVIYNFTSNSTNKCGLRRATCIRTTWVLEVQIPGLGSLESRSPGTGFRVFLFFFNAFSFF